MSKQHQKPAPAPAPIASEDDASKVPTLPPPPPEAPAVTTHAVAAGRSVTSMRGILGPGAVVQARDFGDDGEASLAALVANGCVVEVTK